MQCAAHPIAGVTVREPGKLRIRSWVSQFFLSRYESRIVGVPVLSLIGTPDSFQHIVESLGRQFFKEISAANRLFASQPR